MATGEILQKVNAPADLKALPLDELEQLAADVRALILETVSKTGGHLAPNLGVVELTVALLKVFSPPQDKILWDTSHQTYAYKILTGRKDRMHTIRQFGGLSGFASRAESEYDAFGAGHAGTAVSAALGMAVARDRRGGAEHVVAVMGDGAVGCGISLEALNNVADTTRRLIVIMNDNEMSISANVGSLSRSLGRLLTSPRYNRWKRSVEGVGHKLKMDWLRSGYYRVEEALKSLFLRSVFFEELGLRYVGPIDGHNLHALLDALQIARDSHTPILLHVSTQKGKGYSFAEERPEKWHGTSSFDVDTGEARTVSSWPTYSQVFGATLEELAASDDRIVAITAGMKVGTGLSGFAERFPGRFYDVGISEEHAVVFAAGLAASGLVPVFAVYSTFVQRAVDCVIHDVCLQNLPVILCLDRAGIVGDDGPTHHGIFDLALLAPVPGLVIMQPKDEAELADMLYTAVRLGRPVALRYPRGVGPGVPLGEKPRELGLGRAEVLAEGRDLAIWALGDMVQTGREVVTLLAADGISAGLVNARFVRPLDEELLVRQAKAVSLFATLENHMVAGGFGACVEDLLGRAAPGVQVLKFGWPDQFIAQGSPALLAERYGLTPRQIADAVARACPKRRA